MRRVVGLVLAACLLSLGTGAAGYAHHLQHAHGFGGHHHDRHPAADHGCAGHDHGHERDAPAQPTEDPGEPAPHDESACHIHALLRAPLMAGGWVPALVGVGAFVAFLPPVPESLVSCRVPLRVACRGPPAC